MGTEPLMIKIKKPDKESLCLFLWLNLSLITAVVRFVLKNFGLESGTEREIFIFLTSCIPLVVLLFGTKKMSSTIQKRILSFLCLYCAIAMIAFVSAILNPHLIEFYFRDDYGIGPVFRPDGAIFAFLFFSLIDDIDKLWKVIVTSAYVTFFYLIIVVLMPAINRGFFLDIAPGGGTMVFSYSLSFGYNMLFPLTVFFAAALKSHKIVHYALAIVSAILIVVYGGRGAVVVSLLFLILLIVNKIIDENTSFTRKFLLMTGVILTVIVVFLFGEVLLALLIRILSDYNINSRSIETLIGGSFSRTNGRIEIWETVIEAIRNGGLLGYGFFGDRPFVAPLHYVAYTHNLFLELLVSFGILGVGCIIFIIVDAVRMIFLCKDENWRIVYLILFVCSCKLFLSMTLWYVWEFWAAAAVAYKYKHLVGKRKHARLSSKQCSQSSSCC